MRYLDASSLTFPINSGVSQGSVLGPFLYSIHTADLPIPSEVISTTFADDTALLSSHEDSQIASSTKPRPWKNGSTNGDLKSTKINQRALRLRKRRCPSVTYNNSIIPTKDSVKYLGLHLDRRLTWKQHIKAKCKQLKLIVKQYYWLLVRRSNLSLENQLLLYKVILKPIWTYGIQLWCTASNSNIEILQRFQSKTVRIMTNTSLYVANETPCSKETP